MTETFISEDFVSLDDIDTSEIECGEFDDDSSDFYDSFFDESGFVFSTDGTYMYESKLNLLEDTDESEASDVHLHNVDHSSEISFTGNGRCRVCGCRQWAGYGNTCENCGHFYNKHI